MRTHQDIDRRSLTLARAIVDRIDRDPEHHGLLAAREVCRRWLQAGPRPAVAEWQDILAGSWRDVRAVLLRDDEEGRRLRQNSPFCSVLSARERWDIYRQFAHESPAA